MDILIFCWCRAVGAALLLFTLAGCARNQPTMRGHSNTSATGAGMGMMDAQMAAMCHELYQQMATGRTEEQRQAIMHEHTKAMSPAMRRSMEQNIGANRCR